MDDATLQELKQRGPGLSAIYQTGRGTILRAADLSALEQARVQVLGRRSPITEFLRSIPSLPADERPLVGRGGNVVRKELEALVEQRDTELASRSALRVAGRRALDVTLPPRAVAGRPRAPPDAHPPRGGGHLHRARLQHRRGARGGARLLQLHGAQHAAEPPCALRPRHVLGDRGARDHARSGRGRRPRRTAAHPHLSVQVRVMEQQRPPVYVLCPGKVYRRDSDATHTPMFHQIEGLVVDEGITLTDLKGTVAHFTRAFFGGDRDIRVRPHFFPFTEPSIEVDVSCGSAAARAAARASTSAGSRSWAPAWSTRRSTTSSTTTPTR